MQGWDTRLDVNACGLFPLMTALTYGALKGPSVVTSEAVIPQTRCLCCISMYTQSQNYIHLPMLSGWQASQQKCPVFLEEHCRFVLLVNNVVFAQFSHTPFS